MYPITDRPRPRGGPPRPARRRPPDGIVLAGAHGGAGTSTLAALLAPAWDMGVVSGRPLPAGCGPAGRPVVLAARNTVAAAGRAVTAASALAGAGLRWRCWWWSATGCPSRPRPGTGSGSWRAASAPWSACRSSRPSAWPPTRPRWTCRGGHARRWPRSGRSPASRRHARRRQPESKGDSDASDPSSRPGGARRRCRRAPEHHPLLARPRWGRPEPARRRPRRA